MRLPPSASQPGTPPRSAMGKSWTTCARCWSRRNFPAVTRWSSGGRRRFTCPFPACPKRGVNQLFACAVQHPNLHTLIEKYARLAMKEFEWYNNLEDEACAMHSEIARALGLEGEPWVPLVCDYLDLCDDEHSSLQEKFIHTFSRNTDLRPRPCLSWFMASSLCRV